MMRRISFLLLFLSWLTVPVLAQVVTVHVVKRGETVATIAKQYGVSEADIRTVNPNLTTVFAGVKLNIPVKKSVAEGNKVVRQAKTASQRSTGMTTPKAATSAAPKPAPQQNYYAFNSHYLKGQGYIRDKKWKKAIQELNLAMAQPAPAKERSHCQQLLAYAEREKNARSERRAAFLSGLSAGLQTLGQGLQDMAQNQQQQSARAPQRAPQQYPQHIADAPTTSSPRDNMELPKRDQQLESQLSAEEIDKLNRLRGKAENIKSKVEEAYRKRAHQKKVDCAIRRNIVNTNLYDKYADEEVQKHDEFYDVLLEIEKINFKNDPNRIERTRKHNEEIKQKYRKEIEKQKLGHWTSTRGATIISRYSDLKLEITDINVKYPTANLSINEKRNIVKRNQKEMKELRSEYKKKTGKDVHLADNQIENWNPRDVDLLKK